LQKIGKRVYWGISIDWKIFETLHWRSREARNGDGTRYVLGQLPWLPRGNEFSLFEENLFEGPMTLTKEKRTDIIKDYGRAAGDVGSPEVQVALLTERINHLTEHLARNTKDYSTRRGLLGLVSRRRGLLDYVRSIDPDKYLELLNRLNIRK
jgi:small subunit ribosomal protein S15